RIINIKNPEAPQEVGSYDIPGSARAVTIAGSYAYLAAYNSGLRIINIKNPDAPQEVGFYDTPDEALNVTIAGSYAYVADGAGGLMILRFTGADTPTLKQQLYLPLITR
ncbi:MAG: LVIVD repeat-containing protein, partial [Ardenticatenaceae bacterium]